MRSLKHYLLSGVLSLLLSSVSFVSHAQGHISDIEGNNYSTIQVGGREWMAENLRTTKYNDGTSIAAIADNKEWVKMTGPGYSWYEGMEANKATYGGLYNWQAVETGKLCPQGWCVPSDDDWSALLAQLGDSPIETLEKLGFSVVAGGYRYGYFWGPGTYHEQGVNGYWWSATPKTDTHKWARTISIQNAKVYRSYFEKNDGFSVRCIKCENN